MPPPRSSGISRALVPIGNSNTPVRLARPDTPYSLVPPSLDLPCDRPLNQSAPCTTIGAMLHSDSTLLTTVGRPQAPEICGNRSEEHTSELQSLMRNSYAVFCLKKKNTDPMNKH